MPCCTVHTNEPHQAQRVVKLQRSHPRVSSFGGEISASNRCRHPCQRPSRCGGERLLMCTCLYMLCHNLCVCVLRSIVFFFTMQAVKDQQRDQRNCGNSARHSSSMGQHAICSTTTSIVRRPVRLHAASVKLACRKSAFNRSSSGLHFTCPAARAASHRKKTVMGLPIPIIGKLAILEAWQKYTYWQYRR